MVATEVQMTGAIETGMTETDVVQMKGVQSVEAGKWGMIGTVDVEGYRCGRECG